VRGTVKTAIKPAPPAVQDDEDGFVPVTLTSNDIHVKVRATKLRR
jgi:hypothetical protein